MKGLGYMKVSLSWIFVPMGRPKNLTPVLRTCDGVGNNCGESVKLLSQVVMSSSRLSVGYWICTHVEMCWQLVMLLFYERWSNQLIHRQGWWSLGYKEGEDARRKCSACDSCMMTKAQLREHSDWQGRLVVSAVIAAFARRRKPIWRDTKDGTQSSVRRPVESAGFVALAGRSKLN